MAYALHVLRPGDLFVDVGANIGSYTLLVCMEKKCRGICFEPVPDTYSRLAQNVRVNDLNGRVTCLNCGVGQSEGELIFTADHNTCNRVVPHDLGNRSVRVRTVTLDQALKGENPSAIKIDVEGFETPVLEGAQVVLRQPSLHSIVIELNGQAAHYGFDEAAIVHQLQAVGFAPFTYEPFARKLVPLAGKNQESGNTLFIRDLPGVQRRVAESPPFTVNGIQV